MLFSEERDELDAISYLFTEGIDLTRIQEEPIARSPLTVRLGDGIAVAYRYGALVLFGVDDLTRRAFIGNLQEAAAAPDKDGDAAKLRRGTDAAVEGTGSDGTLVLRTFDVPRLRVVAEVLARSAILTYYEQHLGGLLIGLEPAVARLRQEGRLPAKTRSLLRGVGEVLNTEMRMISRAEVSEKPEFVWDEADLDRLYLKLAEEYELGDRDRALSRKLDLAMRTTSILMEALGARRALHIEWAIFLLILIELFVML